jgi:hypothetical protein
MNDSAAFQFVRQLGVDLAAGEFELPPFPDTPLRVQRTVNDDNATLDDLAPIVASEPALAARLMRMANSAMMRRGPMEVTDIATAIGRLGMEMVLNAAVVYAAREAFKAPPGSPCVEDLNKLRRHSARVAALSYAMARNTGYRGKPDEAMLAGLLHAVGKFYIFMKAADHPQLFADRSGLEALMQQWHTGVARAIVESWGFPENDRPRRGRAGTQGARPHRLGGCQRRAVRRQCPCPDRYRGRRRIGRPGRPCPPPLRRRSSLQLLNENRGDRLHDRRARRRLILRRRPGLAGAAAGGAAACHLDGQETGQEAQQDHRPPFGGEGCGTEQAVGRRHHRGDKADSNAQAHACQEPVVGEGIEGEHGAINRARRNQVTEVREEDAPERRGLCLGQEQGVENFTVRSTAAWPK